MSNTTRHTDGLDETIAAQRPRLFGLAYRMLGSAATAEDIVQEAFVRWYASSRESVRNDSAFLTTVVTNLCLDHLKSARVQREGYRGPWLAEPIAVDAAGLAAEDAASDRQPSTEAELERLESISLAFLAVLDTLTPLERAVYLLHEVFDYRHEEIAAIVGRNAAACRQVHRRARRALRERRAATATPERHREVLGAFLDACRNGDLAALTRMLAEDVVARSDGGGRVGAANRPLHGRRAVARLYTALWRRMPPGTRADVIAVNGWPALVVRDERRLYAVIQPRTSGTYVDRIDAVVNPDKLHGLAHELGLAVAGDLRRARPGAASLLQSRGATRRSR